MSLAAGDCVTGTRGHRSSCESFCEMPNSFMNSFSQVQKASHLPLLAQFSCLSVHLRLAKIGRRGSSFRDLLAGADFGSHLSHSRACSDSKSTEAPESQAAASSSTNHEVTWLALHTCHRCLVFLGDLGGLVWNTVPDLLEFRALLPTEWRRSALLEQGRAVLQASS